MNKRLVPFVRFRDYQSIWQEYKIGELFTVTRGQVLATSKTSTIESLENPYPVYSSQTKNNGLMGFYKSYLFDTAITWTTDGANAGTVKFRSGKFYSTNVNGVLLSNNGYTNIAVAEALNKVAWKYVSKVGNPKLMNNIMSEIKLRLPESIKEQNEISSFFKSLDDTIALHQQELEALKQTKQGFLQKMFPRAGESIPEFRFPEFKKEWTNYKIADISKVTMGQSPSGKNYTSNPNDHILVQGNADIKKGYVHPRVWTTQVTKTANPGDIILCVRAPVGDVAKTSHEVVLGRGVASLEGGEFLYHLLYKMKSEKYWTRFSTGSTFESINSTDIKDAVVMIPSKDEQLKIGEFFRQLDEVIELKEKEIEALKETKKGFLQKMFV